MVKKAPTRTCIACATSADKRELVRIVRDASAHVAIDASGKAAGRGAYLCRREVCFAEARKRRLFDAKLRTKLTNEDYDRLEEDFHMTCVERKDMPSRDGE